MAFPPFADAGQLASALGLDTIDTVRADLVLAGVSASLREEVGWPVTEEAGTVRTLDGSGAAHLLLPTKHLTAVAEVVEDGVVLVEGTDFAWHADGRLDRLAGGPESLGTWTSAARGVVATFTHGFPDGSVPEIFETVALERAAARWPNPSAVRSESTLSYSVTYFASANGNGSRDGDRRLAAYTLEPSF